MLTCRLECFFLKCKSEATVVRKKRILLVEDNMDAVEIMRLIMESLGYEVTVARNGLEGVEMARSQVPDLIVMDILLPIMDGLEATARIRKNPDTQKIPILAATVLALPGERERCLASGCDNYISKPFTPRQFEGVVKSLVVDR